MRESYARTALGPPGIDLLFVIDSASSMAEEQAAFAEAVPTMIRQLASGDLDQDGDTDDIGDFDPERLHVGVITTDVGTGGHALASCAEPDFGDDGLLQTRGSDLASCPTTHPSFLAFRPGSGVPDAFAREVACAAQIGTSGCEVRQPLEAILKALSPSARQPWTHMDYVPPGEPSAPDGLQRPFFRASSPHGDAANDGFSHSSSSLLTIVPLTNADDCSIHDPALFDPLGPHDETEPTVRCFAHPEALHPIERYVNGLLQLRSDPRRLVFAPIVGVPVELATRSDSDADWERLTSPDCETPTRDRRLCEHLDPSAPDRLAPSCIAPGAGGALPPTRILQVARELEARGAAVTVQSICEASYEEALARVAQLIRPSGDRLCLGRPFSLEDDGTIACEVHVRMPLGAGCDREGYSPLLDPRGSPTSFEGHAMCKLRQLVPESREPGAAPPEEIGWFYDTFTREGARACGDVGGIIALAGARLPQGAQETIECWTRIDELVPGYGSACAPSETGACGESAIDDPPLACDPLSGACGVPCETDEQCHDAWLTGSVCDRPWRVAGPSTGPPTSGFCVSATCG